MSSVSSVEGDEAAKVSQNRVERFIAAIMGEDELSEEAKKVLRSLAGSDKDLAQIGLEELKQILLEALQ
jgi:hypothetical protein